jgi:hypothetical protein
MLPFGPPIAAGTERHGERIAAPLDSRDPSLKEAEMTLPAPPPERGTRIVLVGSTKDALLTVDVEEIAPAVELSGRISQLTRDDGLPIWVNLANVLYVEGVKL